MNKHFNDNPTDLTTISRLLDSEYQSTLKDAFIKIGLNVYESKVLISLYILKESEAKAIATTAQVPMGRVYSALENLSNKGLIQKIKVKGKPFRYRANEFEPALRLIQDKVKEEVDEALQDIIVGMKQLQKVTIVPDPEPLLEPIEVVFGEWNISRILRETILSTEEDLSLSLSIKYLKSQKPALEIILKRNCTVLAISVSDEDKNELDSLNIPIFSINLQNAMPALKMFFLEKNTGFNGVMVDNRIVFLILLEAEKEPYGVLIRHPSLVHTFSLLVQSLITQLDE
ncbi:MAG: TrmB family transcriptional regulator [Candidatus Heimdallarchaeota archaeon]|nr:TrmB family transcriptional regulator [Candidatus Heimdallarchaeota archaeon]